MSDKTYLPSELAYDFPALVTDTHKIGGALYVFVGTQKAQTKLKNLTYRDGWYCAGYGNQEGAYYVRFVQVRKS